MRPTTSTSYSSGPDPHIYVVKATAGTTTFGAPSEVTDLAESTPDDAGVPLYWYDDPWIAVTTSQEIVVVYARREWATCPPNVNLTPPLKPCGVVMVGRSTDAVTWTREQVSPDGAGSDGGPDAGAGFAFPENPFACVSATTGRLWVVYETMDANADESVVLQYSDDDGATWSNPTNIVHDIFTNFISDVTTCAADGDDVWVEYETRSGPGLAGSIQVVHSTNGGQSFESSVNALDIGTSSLAWHAALVLEAGGHLDIEYYGGHGDGDPKAGVYFVHSTDQGASWGKATRIYAPITLMNDQEGSWTNGWLGRYLGVTTAGGALYTTFTDNASGVARVDFAKVALP